MKILRISFSVYKEIYNTYPTYHYPHGDGYVLGAGGLNIYVTRIFPTKASDFNYFVQYILPNSQLVEKEDDLISVHSLKITSSTQQKYDLRDTVIYIGKALPGVGGNEQGWTINKITLDNDGNPIQKQSTIISEAIWDNRENEFFQ